MAEIAEIDLKHLAVVTALNHMLRGNSFSICTIDKCADILGVSPRGIEAYKVLSALHCIDYGVIPKPLRDQIPELIRQCLNLETFPHFVQEEAAQTGPKRNFFRRLLRDGAVS